MKVCQIAASMVLAELVAGIHAGKEEGYGSYYYYGAL